MGHVIGTRGGVYRPTTPAVAGTNGGRLIACADDGWEQIGIVPAEIGALCEI